MSRHLSPELYTDEWFGTQDLLSRMLWIGLLTAVADDQGRFINNPAIIRVKVFPYDEHIKINDIKVSLDKFIQAKRIHAYTFGLNGSSKDCLQIVNWWRYQRSSRWMSQSKLDAPQGWTDRVHCHTTGNQILDLNWDKEGGFTVRPTEQQQVQPLNSREAEDEAEVKGEAEDEVKGEGDSSSMTALLKTCGIPKKYQAQILARHELGRTDILAELTRNFSRKDKIKSPGVITAMNLANGEIAGAEWYDEKRWTKYLPIMLLKNLGIDFKDELLAIQNGVDNDYTNFEEESEQNVWETAKGVLAGEVSPGTFSKRIKNTRMVDFGGGVMMVSCQDIESRDWLTDHIKKTVEHILAGICNNQVVVHFTARS